MIDIVGLESIGKYIIWLWSKYVKRKHIPYMDLEFHYPNYLFIVRKHSIFRLDTHVP